MKKVIEKVKNNVKEKNNMAKSMLEKNGEITMKKKAYQAKIGREFNKGQVAALIKVGKTIPEISEILGFKESAVRSLAKEVEK